MPSCGKGGKSGKGSKKTDKEAKSSGKGGKDKSSGKGGKDKSSGKGGKGSKKTCNDDSDDVDTAVVDTTTNNTVAIGVATGVGGESLVIQGLASNTEDGPSSGAAPSSGMGKHSKLLLSMVGGGLFIVAVAMNVV